MVSGFILYQNLKAARYPTCLRHLMAATTPFKAVSGLGPFAKALPHLECQITVERTVRRFLPSTWRSLSSFANRLRVNLVGDNLFLRRHMKKIGFYISYTTIALLMLFVCSTKQSAQSGTFTTANVAVGLGPTALAVNPLTNKIYVANGDSGDVTVINGTDDSTTTVTAGTFPNHIAVNPATNKIYVTNSGSNDVTVIDGTNNSTTTVAAGSAPGALAGNL